MPRNTSIIIGDQLTEFVAAKVADGSFESTSEVVRAGLRLLQERETQLDLLRRKLAVGEAELDRGEGVDGDAFMRELIG